MAHDLPVLITRLFLVLKHSYRTFTTDNLLTLIDPGGGMNSVTHPCVNRWTITAYIHTSTIRMPSLGLCNLCAWFLDNLPPPPPAYLIIPVPTRHCFLNSLREVYDHSFTEPEQCARGTFINLGDELTGSGEVEI